jgi:hypothetical protein
MGMSAYIIESKQLTKEDGTSCYFGRRKVYLHGGECGVMIYHSGQKATA